jgi:type II secretory pathway pseudopilin PulG
MGVPVERRRRRGYSLVEMLLATALVVLIINAAYDGATILYRSGAWINTRADNTSTALLALNRLDHELRASAMQTVTINDNGNAIAFQINDPNAPSNKLNYFQGAPYYIIYLLVPANPPTDPPSGNLVREIWTDAGANGNQPPLNPDPLAASPPTSLTQSQLATIVGNPPTPNAAAQIIAMGITAMTICPASASDTALSAPTYPNNPLQTQSPPTPISSISVSLQVQRSFESKMLVTQNIRTSVTPRNSFIIPDQGYQTR